MGINADLNVNNFLIPSIKKKIKFVSKEIYLINNHNREDFEKAYTPSKIRCSCI